MYECMRRYSQFVFGKIPSAKMDTCVYIYKVFEYRVAEMGWAGDDGHPF